jgi:hypothetical protein
VGLISNTQIRAAGDRDDVPVEDVVLFVRAHLGTAVGRMRSRSSSAHRRHDLTVVDQSSRAPLPAEDAPQEQQRPQPARSRRR